MQNLYYNITAEQELFWDAPEGRPSSVTSVTVYASESGDDGTTESATTGTAAVETNPNTTFDAASGDGQADPRICNLTATTGIAVGRSYLATSATGESEWVEVRAITAAASVQARHNLVNAYAAADTFESTRITIAVDDTWIADSNKISDDLNPNPGYRVRWVYVVDGIKRVHDSYFNVVRYRASHDVRPGSIAERYSNWINSLPSEHIEDQGARLIDKAYSTLSFDLHRMSIPAEMLRNRSVVNELTELKAIMMSESDRAKRTGDSMGYDIARDEYQATLDGLVMSGRTQAAQDASGAAVPSVAVSLWSK